MEIWKYQPPKLTMFAIVEETSKAKQAISDYKRLQVMLQVERTFQPDC